MLHRKPEQDVRAGKHHETEIIGRAGRGRAACCSAATRAGARRRIIPTRPVKIVIAFSPSGAIDVLGRFIAQHLSEMWGQQVIVENRPGGSGNIGAAAASAAPPDGYTLHFGAQTLAVNVTLSPTTAFDPVTSFEPIMLVATAQEVFTVAVQTPFKSINDVIAYAKANPGKLNYGSVGIGSSAHLATVLFSDVVGIKMQHVPYSQMSQGITDVLTGRTEVWFTTFSGPLPHIKSGTVRAFAVTGPKRAALLPDLPTFTELGIKMGEEFELVRALRAEGHAEADHRQDQPRPEEGSGDARHEGARGAARLSLHRRLAGGARGVPQARHRQMAGSRQEGLVQVGLVQVKLGRRRVALKSFSALLIAAGIGARPRRARVGAGLSDPAGHAS